MFEIMSEIRKSALSIELERLFLEKNETMIL